AQRLASGYGKSMSAAGKLRFVLTDVFVQPGTLLLALLLAATIALHRRSGDGRAARLFTVQSGFLTLLLCATLAGAFAPTPLWVMYFFTPLPLIVLLLLCFGAQLAAGGWARALWTRLFTAAAA